MEHEQPPTPAEDGRIPIAPMRGDRDVPGAALLPKVYDQLRRLAAQRLATQPPGQTLQPTALVHEAFMRLTAKGDPGWDNAGHFYAAAATAMRYVLVDHARARLADKRGGGVAKARIDVAEVSFDSASEDILALDELVSKLAQHHPRHAELLNLKFFAGLTDTQIATTLDVSSKTVQRDFRFARAWLLAHWQGEDLPQRPVHQDRGDTTSDAETTS